MTGGPGTLPEAGVELAVTGWRIWVRLLGRKHAGKLMVGGLVVSTIVAVILNARF